jgi:beta-glucanase (GH16 family)
LAAFCLVVLTIGGRAPAQPPSGKGYKIDFADEFAGATLDTSAWNYGYPWGTTHNGMANMLPSQVKAANGTLTLTAIAQRTIWDPWGYWDGGLNKYISFDYTSGTVNTYGKKTWRYGYFEARFKMPAPLSTWPAFWGLQDGWPPEVDIFEVQGDRRRSYYNYHYTANGGHASFGGQYWGPDLSAGWHVFGFEWTPWAMRFYVDGQLQQTFTDAAAIDQQKWLYLIIDLQVGGWAPDPVASEYPAQLTCDWIRVWKPGGPASGVYRLTPRAAPTLALATSAGSPDNGAAAAVNAANYAVPQQWKVERQEDGSYKIRAFAGTTTTRVLDVANGTASNGAAVIIWDDNGGINQRWYFVDAGSGWYRITSALDTAKCLEASVTSPAPGTSVDIRDNTGGYNQLWRLDPPDQPIPGDANLDGNVTAADVRVVLEMAAGSRAASPYAARAADVAPRPSADPRGYGDGQTDIRDAARVARRLVGLEPVWP